MKKYIINAVTAIIIALIGGVLSNADRLYAIYKESRQLPTSLSGEWYGSFREFDSKNDSEGISHDTVVFKSYKGGIRGTLSTTEKIPRTWSFHGDYHDKVYIASYLGSSKGRSGGTAFVLRGDPTGGVLKGYWMGSDPEKDGRIIVGPYILTTNNNHDEVERKYADWLKQSLYVPLDK